MKKEVVLPYNVYEKGIDFMIDIVNIIIGMISLFIGIVGAISTYKSYLKERRLKSISWEDINNGIKYIWKQLHKIDFKPDFLIAPGADGGIVAYILSEYFDYDVFIDVGYTIYNNSTSFDFYSEKQYTLINTNRLRVFLSKTIQDMPNKENKKILIIDTFVLTGDFNSHLLKLLLEYGYSKENIMVCCIAVTKVATSSSKAPNIYWKIVDNEDFYFPWGKAK